MKKRSKIMTLAVVGILAIGGGMLGVYQYAKVKVGDKVVQVLQDPTVADKILKESNNPAVLAKAQEIASNSLNKTANGSNAETGDSTTSSSNASQGNAANSNTPNSLSVTTTSDNNPSGSAQNSDNPSSSNTNLNFATRQEAIQYAMGKFSPSEIATLMGEYVNRSSLSPAQKAQIKQEVLSHFTAGEVRALVAAAKK